jgi:hypothetical protein
VGTAGLRRAELEIEVEQREPYVMHDHTWSVHMWTSIASSNVLTQGQLDSIMSEPPFASMPDLNARKSEVEFKTLDYRVPRRGGYYVVVVAAVEMTKGPHPAVHAVRTYAKAFQEGGTEWREVKLPEFSEMATMTTVEDTKYEPAPEPGEPKG